MVSGLARFSWVSYFKTHAAESLDHAFKAGELMTGLGGHPSLKPTEIKESHNHDMPSILAESIEHETKAANLYHDLLNEVTGKSVYLEEYARTMIGSEEEHVLDMRKVARNLP
jgi:bacterioferritin